MMCNASLNNYLKYSWLQTNLSFLYIAEWIGTPYSSLPVISVQTHNPPGQKFRSNATISQSSELCDRCLSVHRPAGPAPITAILFFSEAMFSLKCDLKNWEYQMVKYCHIKIKYSEHADNHLILAHQFTTNKLLFWHGLRYMNLLKQKHYTLIFYCRCNFNESTRVKLLIGLSTQHVINGILRRSDKNKFQATCFYIVAIKSYSLIYKSVLFKDLVHMHRNAL